MNATKRKPAKRQHFLARFYLRNFARPMFSDNLLIFDRKKTRWEERTTNGIGWFLTFSQCMIQPANGQIHLTKFIQSKIEDPKQRQLSRKWRAVNRSMIMVCASIALFIGFKRFAARSPAMISQATHSRYLERILDVDREELERLARMWCQIAGLQFGPNSVEEFLKPSRFGATWAWAKDIQGRLLQWNWHTVNTSPDNPFVTSDYPTFAQWDDKADVRFPRAFQSRQLSH